MQGKICVITGGTTGIGKASAKALAAQGAQVVILGRDPARTAETVAWITQQSGNSQIDSFLCELSSLKQIKRVGSEIAQKYPVIDVLLNNAGAIYEKQERSEDGFEKTWAVNHLAYFAMTQALLPSLQKSRSARVISVSSKLHIGAVIDFDALKNDPKYSAMRTYGRSKLANVLFTYALARRLKGTQVTANCLHPGVVSTGFGKNNRGFLKVAVAAMSPFLRTPDQGAETSVFLASSPAVEGVSAKYFEDCKELRSAENSYDEVLQEKLWKVSEEQVG